MFEWITQIDYEILVFIQEHLRFDWLTEPLVFISHLGNAGLFWIVLCLSLLISRRTRKMGVCRAAGPSDQCADYQCGLEKYRCPDTSL